VIIDNYKEKVKLPAKDGESLVDEALAPYMENCCAEPDRKYMEFYDEEERYRKEYEEGSREMVVMPDGRLLLPWNEEFKVKPKEGESPLESMGRHEVPAHLAKRQVPFNETYATFEEFVKEWHGHKERDHLTGKFGYWQNPNAKWDWYEIGGRWAGFFKLKPGEKGFQGKQYNFAQEYPESNRADVCFKAQLDLEGMRKAAVKRAKARWELARKIMVTPEFLSWEQVKEKFNVTPTRDSKGDIEAARKFYWNQPPVKTFRNYGMTEEGRKNELLDLFEGPDEFQVPLTEYMDRARRRAVTTHAFVKNGKWHEHGRMMMFATVDPSTELDEETWWSMYSNMLDELPDDALLVLVDCHI
jgi:hypothetical protein